MAPLSGIAHFDVRSLSLIERARTLHERPTNVPGQVRM
jgi:hypothetical protein